MPEYISVSLDEGVRESLQQFKEGNETYSDVIRRALIALRDRQEKQKSRWEYHNARTAEQSRLLVRMADEIGLEADQIPDQMAAGEALGKTETLEDVFQPPDEQVSDVRRAEKRARWQARKEVLDLERGEDGFLRPRDAEGDRARVHITEEQEELIEERTAAILDEENAGGTPPWEADNEGDNA